MNVNSQKKEYNDYRTVKLSIATLAGLAIAVGVILLFIMVNTSQSIYIANPLSIAANYFNNSNKSTTNTINTINSINTPKQHIDINTLLQPMTVYTSLGPVTLPIQHNIFNWDLYSTITNNHFLKRKQLSSINFTQLLSNQFFIKRISEKHDKIFISVAETTNTIAIDKSSIFDCENKGYNKNNNESKNRSLNCNTIRYDDSKQLSKEKEKEEIFVTFNNFYINHITDSCLIDYETKILWQRIAKNGSTKLLLFWISLFLDFKYSPSSPKQFEYSKNPRTALGQIASSTNHTFHNPKYKNYEKIMNQDLFLFEIEKIINKSLQSQSQLQLSGQLGLPQSSSTYTYGNNNIRSNTQDWIKIIVLRDPLTRLVSAYLDKCTPFVHDACEFVLSMLPGRDVHVVGEDGKNIKQTVTFDEVVDVIHKQWVIDPTMKGFVNGHFAPQAHKSNICFMIEKFDYIIILDKETFGINIFQLLQELKILNRLKHGNDIDFYWKQGNDNKPVFDVELDDNGQLVLDKEGNRFTGHATSESSQQELKLLRDMFSNKDTLIKAMQLFKYDYLFLPFEYPPQYLMTL